MYNLCNTGIINLKEPFEVTPTEVFFHNIQSDNIYEISVFVKNLTKKAKRIRVFQPKSSKFRCDYEIKGPIAAGLSVKLTIKLHFKEVSRPRF